MDLLVLNVARVCSQIEDYLHHIYLVKSHHLTKKCCLWHAVIFWSAVGAEQPWKTSNLFYCFCRLHHMEVERKRGGGGGRVWTKLPFYRRVIFTSNLMKNVFESRVTMLRLGINWFSMCLCTDTYCKTYFKDLNIHGVLEADAPVCAIDWVEWEPWLKLSP